MLYPSTSHKVLRITGPDAGTFLHSQLTNDVTLLPVGGWQWQGLCTAKGRLLATFALAKVGEDAFEAVVHSSTIEALGKRLLMFRLRSKLSIEIAADRVVLYAFAGAPVDSAGFIMKLTDGRAFVIANLADATPTIAPAGENVESRWQLANIDSMIPEVTADTAEMFVPQMIAWDVVSPGGGVSFSKGCYPGQEVVARAHYRGAVKRHLEQQTLPAGSAIAPGREVPLADGRLAEVCNAAVGADGSLAALVVVAAPAS